MSYAILVGIFVVLYVIDECNCKKYVMQTEKYSALKLLCWMCLFAGFISGIVYLFGLNESGKGPITILVENPNMLMLIVLYPMSLLFSYLAYKYINLSQVVPLVYGNSVIILLSKTIYRSVRGDIAGLQELLSLEKILVLCLGIAGYLLLCSLSLAKNDDKPEAKKDYKAFIGLIFAFLSLCFSGIENKLDQELILNEEVGDFDFIGTYYFMGVVMFAILWIILFFLEQKPFNMLNIKKEKPALKATLAELLASGSYLLASFENEEITPIFLSLVPIIIIFVSRKMFLEKFKIEEFMGTIMLIVAVLLINILNSFA